MPKENAHSPNPVPQWKMGGGHSPASLSAPLLI